MSGKGFTLKRRSSDAWLKNQTYTSSGGGLTFMSSAIQSRQWKPNAGRQSIRILPPDPSWQDYEMYGLRVGRHFDVGGGSVLCPIFMHQQLPDIFTETRCPICEDRLALYQDGKKDQAKKLFAKEGILMWLIDRNNEKAGPQWWIGPMKKFHMDLMVLAFQEKTQTSIIFDDPYEGRDINFRLDRPDNDPRHTQYGALQLEMEASPIFENEKNTIAVLEWVAKHPLPQMVEVKSYEELQKLWGGAASLDDSAESDDDIYTESDVDSSTYNDDIDLSDGTPDTIPEVELNLDDDDSSGFPDVQEEEVKTEPRRPPRSSGHDKLDSILTGDE